MQYSAISHSQLGLKRDYTQTINFGPILHRF